MSSFGMRTNLELCVYIGANINRGYHMDLALMNAIQKFYIDYNIMMTNDNL